MSFSPKNAPAFDKPADTPDASIRHLERTMGWKAEDWHFRLAPFLDGSPLDQAVRVKNFFSHAKLVDRKLFFDGKTTSFRFDWANRHYRHALAQAFGDIEVILASDRRVLNSFRTIDKEFVKTPEARQRVQEIFERMKVT